MKKFTIEEIKNAVDIVIGDDGMRSKEVIENRFGGEKCTVPGYAAAVYDVIIGAESLQDWDSHRKGLDWFSRNFPKQYMTLLY